MRNQIKIFVHLFVVLFFFEVSYAENWAESMFQERRHDFGSVAIGVDASHAFKFRNIYKQDVEISSIRSSCGCTSYSVQKTHFKSGENGEVVAKLNTSGQFEKDKSATLTIVFRTTVANKPVLQEAQLQVTSYIRPDVVINPGIVEFGSVRQGKSVTKQLTMQYAGHNDWSLLKVEKSSQNIRVEAIPKERGNGRVTYDIFVTLKDETPSGYLQDMVRFITNDPNPDASSIMLPIHGYVSSPLSVRPSPLIIGNINPGETITKNIVIRGETPFQIADVHSDDPRFKFHISKQSNRIHVVPISFRANQDTGLVESVVTVATNMDNQKQVELLIQGNITGAIQDPFPRQMMADRAAPLLTKETQSSLPTTENNDIFVPSKSEKTTFRNQSVMESQQSVAFPDAPPAQLTASLPDTVVSDESDTHFATASVPAQLKKTSKSVFEKDLSTDSFLKDTPHMVEDIFTVSNESISNQNSNDLLRQTEEPKNIQTTEEFLTTMETNTKTESLVVAENLFQEIVPSGKEEKQEVVAMTKLKFVAPKLVQENKDTLAVAPLNSGRITEDFSAASTKDLAKTKATPPVPGMNLTQTLTSSFSPLNQESPVIPHLVIPKLSVVDENPVEIAKELSPMEIPAKIDTADLGENEPSSVTPKPILLPLASLEEKRTVDTISSQNADFSSLFKTSEVSTSVSGNEPLRQQALLNRQGAGKPKIIEPQTTQADPFFVLPESPLISQTPLPEKRSVQHPQTSSNAVGRKPVLIQPGAIPMGSNGNGQRNTVVPPPPRLR